MPMPHRLAASIFFLSIFASTYLSEYVRENIEIFMHIAVFVAFSQLVYFSFLNSYQINYGLSILVVIIVINFIFQGDLKLQIMNVAMNLMVLTTLFLGSVSTINQAIYAFSVILISISSYLLSKSKYRAQEEYEQLFEDSPVGLVQCDVNGEIRDLNNEMLRLSAAGSDKMLRQVNIFEIMNLEEEEIDEVKNTDRTINDEKLLAFPWGEETWVEYKVESIPRNSANPDSIIISLNDISARKETEDEVKYISYHDNLTDLYNRSYFAQEMQRLDKERKYPLGIIFIDIDKLKLVNDAFGHQIGDEMLIKVAEIIERSCRKEDVIARWGGDEILVLLPETREENCEKIMTRMKNNCKKAEFKPVDISISLGFAAKTKHDEDLGLVLKEAEEEMYKRKIAKQEEVNSDILDSIKEELEKKSELISSHTQKVEQYAEKIGRELDLSERQLNRLKKAGKYHDIGKVALEKEILNKDCRELNDGEEKELHRHAEIGYQIASELRQINNVAELILSHHERWDGKGYPQGKNGDGIPLLSRIISVANSFDYLKGRHNNFREKLSQKEALSELKSLSGTELDPEIVGAFEKVLKGI